jgi:hypothetical protein
MRVEQPDCYAALIPTLEIPWLKEFILPWNGSDEEETSHRNQVVLALV